MGQNVIERKVYDIYEHDLEKEVSGGPVPEHLAIIMDGNRRYASEVMGGSDIGEGHKAGKDKLLEVSEWCIQFGIRYVTVYAFSTENFKRDSKEVEFLMNLAAESFREMADHPMVQNNKVHIQAVGCIDILPETVRDAIRYADERTREYKDHVMSVCIAYGGRQEIVDAVQVIARKVESGELRPEDIDESTISANLYMPDIPDPDLVLRTSGEVRISNFLLWQLAYSELYFTDVYWPGFRRIDFLRAIRTYQQRIRRYGS